MSTNAETPMTPLSALREIRAKVTDGKIDLRPIGEALQGKWDQDFMAALLEAAERGFALASVDAERLGSDVELLLVRADTMLSFDNALGVTTKEREFIFELAAALRSVTLSERAHCGREVQADRDALLKALDERDLFLNPHMLDEAADEIDCGDGCEKVSYDYSCNYSECRAREKGEYCPNDVAETLRALAKAARSRTLASSPPPSSDITPERIREMEKALEFYRDGFAYFPKRTKTGIDLSEWRPKPVLLDDCGERAKRALTAPGEPK